MAEPDTRSAAGGPLISQDDVFSDEKHWYAVHTRSRHEKFVYTLIRNRGVDTYLPVKKVLKKWSDRKKIVEIPLFSGYLFVNLALAEKNKVLHTKGVVRLLGKVSPESIPDEQIESLKKFEMHDIEVDPYLHLHEGAFIRVKSGPFRNCSGYLVRKKNKYRLVVNLDVINQSVSVEIDSSDVERGD